MNGYTDQVNFHINGKKFTVTAGQTENSHPHSLLVDYIRREAALTGTKYMCREGGCGACVVTVKVKNPDTGKSHTSSINACMTPVLSCDGWDITTVERLGNHKDGYNLIQKRLVDFSGTQCGYCTPGMVMNMYGLLQSNPGITAKEIEDSFDGNICRCTGFRPILDAFKSLAPDASEEIKRKCAEFEERNGEICKLKSGCCKAGKCLKEQNRPCCPPEIEDICKNSPVNIKFQTGQTWSRPTSLREALDLLRTFVSQRVTYRVVAGNTSTGIFKNDGPFTAYMDVNGIPELRKYGPGLLGAGVKLTRAIELLKQAHSQGIVGCEYMGALATHWLRVANVPVRNAGTIAGNLMIKHAHVDFPSDVYLTLQALGATLNIASAQGTEKTVSIGEFLRMSMVGHLIISINLPSLPKRDGYVFRSFKITKRYQNAHAYVNGAMLFKVDAKFNVTERPRICLGGINPQFVHAEKTEAYLFQKSLADPVVVQAALKTLEQELHPEDKPPESSPLYRKNLARNLLYKTILGILREGRAAGSAYTSGGGDIEYKLTSGKQSYDTHKEEWPLTKPIPKLEAPVQCSGEAQYINDIHPQPGELFGAFVIAKIANADLKSVDASAALKYPGVVSFISAKDIRGPNNFIHVFGMDQQEIFAKSHIVAAGQAIGLVLAESRYAAFEAVKLVKVTYDKVERPVLTIKEALKNHEKAGTLQKIFLPPAKIAGNPAAAKHKLSGEFEIGAQYHFHMETQVALCIPKEGDMMDVYSASQFVDQVQASVASAIEVPNCNVKVEVRRLGGGFGGKGSAATQIATAAAIGARATNRPVRIVLDLDTNMHMIGKRTGYLCKYELGFDDSGKIHALKAGIYADMGCAAVEPDVAEAVLLVQNCYDATGWEVIGANVITNKARSLYCRAPGTTQGIATIETIMEHVAHYLNKDPLQVRMANLIRDGQPVLELPGIMPTHGPFHGQNLIPGLIEQMKANADLDKRRAEVVAWNKANRWVKKGISVVPMRYPQHVFFYNYPCYVAIYHVDGSVIVQHGGIEMGQGINTKVAQTVAHGLGVGLEKIKVIPTDNVVSANAIVTGAAVTSELVCWAGIQACNILKERMAPIRAKQGKDVSWEKLVSACNESGIDLRAGYRPTPADDVHGYNIWALNVTEVEVDILTGQFKIARGDMIEDAGKPMSPEVDVGQIEGSLVMGIGLWTLEKLHFDEKTGELLTPNTWEYKPPFAKDIPEDFRVTLLANAPNPIGVHGSKATGEPPLCSSVAVVFALKQAIDSARQDAGNFDHYQLNTPVTPEDVVLLSLAEREHMKF